MSPPCGVGVFEARIAVVERDPAIESLIKLDFGPGKAEPAVLGRDLEAAALPLHDVVIADDPFVEERTDAVELLWSGTPSFGGVARGVREAAVVVSDEAAQHFVGRGKIRSVGETEFAAQAILEDTPEAFDATFGLRRLRGDEGDAELRESAAKLGRLALTGKFFFEGPVRIASEEDAAAVAVEGGRDTEAAEHALEQAEIALGGFCGKELGREDFAGGIILHTQSGEAWAATFQPVMRAAVELEEFSCPGGTRTTLTMSGSATFTWRAQAIFAKQAAQGFAAERKALDLVEFFSEMVVVEAGIFRAGQTQDGLASALGQAAVAGSAAVGVSQRRLPGFAHAFLQAFNLAHAQAKEFGGAGTRHLSLDASANHAHSLQFLLTQRECLRSHGVTFSRCC
jgi:hypothetical protein